MKESFSITISDDSLNEVFQFQTFGEINSSVTLFFRRLFVFLFLFNCDLESFFILSKRGNMSI